MSDNIQEKKDDWKYDEWLEDLRVKAIEHVETTWANILQGRHIKKDPLTGLYHEMRLHDAIWHASTNILPSLEVQAVIDSKNNIFVSTGTAGYVDYLTIDPSTLIGMKLPIKCWIHTHPFGQAYFSGTDWRTINIWKSMMEYAYVLGSDMTTKGHYGFWNARSPNELEIYENNEVARIQTNFLSGVEEE